MFLSGLLRLCLAKTLPRGNSVIASVAKQSGVALFFTTLLLPTLATAEEVQDKLKPVNHIIVFYLENHSFDNLFGTFPNADGLKNAGNATIQVDKDGKPYKTLPQIKDARFPKDLPNQPFLISKYVKDNEKTPDLVHRFYQLQAQMDNGKMDKFVSEGNSGALPMGYYENKDSPLWQYAEKYTLADHFFTAAIGGSFLNHIWLVCACSPFFENAPEEELIKLDKKNNLLKDGSVTPEGYAVNTIEPFSPPYKAKATDDKRRLPPQKVPTIGDRLSEKNISWAWYSGGWNDANSGKPDPSFIFHHQPFVYFSNYAPETEARKQHLKDEVDLIAGIAKGELPSVVFYKPIGENDLHPGYANLQSSENHVFDIIKKIEKSKLWQDSIIIVTFDDAGGFYDHVAPPDFDKFGAGERVPALLISAFAKKGFIDHNTYDTTSILQLIEKKFKLEPLTARDKNAGDLTNALE